VTAPPPDVYGESVIYFCRCVVAHGVVHFCALCRSTSVKRPTDPWVPAERCRTCLTDEEAKLLVDLALVTAPAGTVQALRREARAAHGALRLLLLPRGRRQRGRGVSELCCSCGIDAESAGNDIFRCGDGDLVIRPLCPECVPKDELPFGEWLDWAWERQQARKSQERST
jgi:hypothetical protein